MRFAFVPRRATTFETVRIPDTFPSSVFGYFAPCFSRVVRIHATRCPKLFHGRRPFCFNKLSHFIGKFRSRFTLLSLRYLASRFFGHPFALSRHSESPEKTGLIRWNSSGMRLVTTKLLTYVVAYVKQTIPSQQRRLRIGFSGVCDGQG
jgi:hypothetical protein